MPEFNLNFSRFNFQTINQAADALGIPRHWLRRAQKLGKVPGFYSGSRFYVNVSMLEEKLQHDIEAFPNATPNIFVE